MSYPGNEVATLNLRTSNLYNNLADYIQTYKLYFSYRAPTATTGKYIRGVTPIFVYMYKQIFVNNTYIDTKIITYMPLNPALVTPVRYTNMLSIYIALQKFIKYTYEPDYNYYNRGF